MNILGRIKCGDAVVGAHVVARDCNGFAEVLETEFDKEDEKDLLQLARLGELTQ